MQITVEYQYNRMEQIVIDSEKMSLFALCPIKSVVIVLQNDGVLKSLTDRKKCCLHLLLMSSDQVPGNKVLLVRNFLLTMCLNVSW